ncbi:hypothetical protein CEXT_418961 [Caerostris extrusa]|uniref:Uncharacterized protein n=1 Tax=Caerostris extrusa TaxID=172846 RepID=A0AAV4PCY9_CAEEX|nr:hypothetical protein CEXT_418961 [Caerostris extrusa]
MVRYRQTGGCTCKLPQVPISPSRKNDSLKKQILNIREISFVKFPIVFKRPSRDSLSLYNSPAVFLLLAPYISLFLTGFKKSFNEQACLIRLPNFVPFFPSIDKGGKNARVIH